MDWPERVIDVDRYVNRSWCWPILGVLLGFVSTFELILRARNDNGQNLTVDLLLGLAATLALALVRVHVAVAGTAIAAVVLLTSAISQRLSVGASLAVVAVVLAALVSVIGFVGRWRCQAASRDRSRRVMADTLLAHAARGERARIARELHDVVAHHISMIAVQAEAARLTTPDMPPAGTKRLQAIGDTARVALMEMRRLLGVLREDAGDEPSRAPQPGLERLIDLVDQARDAGAASTRLLVRGHVTPLDPGIELTAYRIVQEALTNARRHAAGAPVDVELIYHHTVLRVRIRDNGPGLSKNNGNLETPAGHGLLGMRERAVAVGGEVQTGQAPGGGFMVEAVLPTPALASVGHRR